MSVAATTCTDLRRESACTRVLAATTVTLLLCGVFDVGRALYCSVRIRLAVDHLATSLAARATPTSELDTRKIAKHIRRLSGIHDLEITGIRVVQGVPHRTEAEPPAPTTVRIGAKHALRLLSPYARFVFSNGDVSVGAAETFQLARSSDF